MREAWEVSDIDVTASALASPANIKHRLKNIFDRLRNNVGRIIGHLSSSAGLLI